MRTCDAAGCAAGREEFAVMDQENRSGQGSAGQDRPTAGTGAGTGSAEQYRLFVGVEIAAKTVTVSWATPQAETQQKAHAARLSSGSGAALAPRPSVKPVTLRQSPEGFAQLERMLGETRIAPQH